MSNVTTNKDVQALVDLARKQGWHVCRTRSNHLQWTNSDGGLYYSASSPSDHKALDNMRVSLRNLGLITDREVLNAQRRASRTGSSVQDETEYYTKVTLDDDLRFQCPDCPEAHATPEGILGHLQHNHNKISCPRCFKIMRSDVMDNHEDICRGRLAGNALSQQIARAT